MTLEKILRKRLYDKPWPATDTLSFAIKASHSSEREKQMERINMEPLVLLADTEARQVYADLGVAMEGTDFATELKELQDEDNKERRKNAAKEVLKLFKLKQTVSASKVSRIRSLRREEATAKADLKEYDRAEAYGKATGNFLPLAKMLGAIERWYDIDNKALLDVPKDWVAPELEKAAS